MVASAVQACPRHSFFSALSSKQPQWLPYHTFVRLFETSSPRHVIVEVCCKVSNTNLQQKRPRLNADHMGMRVSLQVMLTESFLCSAWRPGPYFDQAAEEQDQV